MRKLLKAVVLGASAAALAGAALAADPKSRVMDVALPDGSTATIEYYGDVPPKVTIAPPVFRPGVPIAWPAMPDIDAMIAEMNRRTAELMREVGRISQRDPVMSTASTAGLPAGASSVSVVSVSNGSGTCTRTTEVVSQGPGKPPTVTTRLSGQCGPAGTAPPAGSSGAINHT